MDKKNILAKAAEELKSKKDNVFVRFWRWIKRQTAAAWKWMRGLDKLVYFNIVLLALVCVLLFVMLGNVKERDAVDSVGYTVTERTQVMDLAASAERPNRPTVVVSRNSIPMIEQHRQKARAKQVTAEQKITLPLRQVRVASVNRRTVDGNIVIDGRGRNVAMPSMATINGNLYLQNLRNYTLPCGTKINGHLFLRDVSLLKFCGCFDVRGNIYVSSNSSFGPIPKDAILGGQVIF